MDLALRTTIIGVCWISGTLVGLLPLFGWHRPQSSEGMKCLFTEVMDYDYLLFLYFATIVAPALLMAAFYAHIYRVVLNQLRRIVTMNPSGGCTSAPTTGGTMLRMLGPTQKREVKATQNLSIIVLFFIICWIPLYTINCVQAFCPDCIIPLELTNFCIILSHANSAVNPLLYAYHLRDFRAALKTLLCCLFGSKGRPAGTDLQDCRFGSHNTLHQYGVNTPTRNNSLLSLQQIRTPQQQQLYAEFSTMSTKTTSCNLASGSKIQSPLSTIITNMNSIHQAIADLALGEDTADDQQRRRRMWTLTEVSSTYEEDRPVNSVHLALEHSGDSCVQRRSGTHRESGQVNSAYIEEPIVMDYTEEDDDVFVSGAVATLSSNIAGFNERLFIRNTMMENENDTIQNSGNVLVPRQSKEQFELGVQHTGSVSSRNSAGAGFPESSSKLYRPNSLIIDEADITNYSLDDHDMTKLSPCRCRMKEVIVASNDGINCNGANVLTLGSENNVSSTGISENNRTHISSENLRLSPLKIVGEFLFHTNSKKPTRLKDVLNESCEFKKNGGECEDSLDCHSAVQRLKGSETPQDNGCAVHKHEVTKCVDDTVT
ncbi:uncharacterized protein LOC111868216 [Cryptotermes secundus]|nr:uncharacterized protein LOC111868216 [Cryptotermes secundus]